MTLSDDVPVVTEPSRERLTERQRTDYRMHRETLLEWIATFGKDPVRVEGYSASTVVRTAYRLDQFYRWVWNDEGYTTSITTDHADQYLREMAAEDKSNTHKNNVVSSLKRLFKWQANERGGEEWEPDFRFQTSHDPTQPKDYFTRGERSKLREAALEYGSVPAYNDLAPRARSKWKAHLAQRFEKPKSEVTPEDWDRANGWKIPSLVWTSLDTGLRPVEVERATIDWIDIKNGVLRIPADESAKNTENWTVSLTDRTTESLQRWLAERENYEKYDDSRSIWLTREGSPYQTHSLRYLLGRLCDVADIETTGRTISWYTIRHSVGTILTREEDLAATQAQLRHRSVQTTMRYDQASVEDRRDALDRMG